MTLNLIKPIRGVGGSESIIELHLKYISPKFQLYHISKELSHFDLAFIIDYDYHCDIFVQIRFEHLCNTPSFAYYLPFLQEAPLVRLLLGKEYHE